ncbi:hypothetical protein CONPUDRAFT_163506 [Coniophora puteana RWD-64-598 SS2]|uniref:Uncharacterized protein n=1 Tax=Coniophora puteana (strain RWD-64-598) TaxID=741705 RepID=A0A5M3MYZ5_CONPW|nr:uncharacterized protein CONPUDRAFT_163506 [Coniophora puteana RWD-64-598 SS2]EIW84362.1 hypothetical protein CONPUDRAFT_163506 [Coniophora puteana RWD-64-598 SS2]
MKFSVPTFLTCAAFAATSWALPQRRDCADSSKFGDLEVVPSNLAPGDSFTVHVDFTCANQLGVYPKYTDYYFAVPVNNNGYEPPVLLYRMDYGGGTADTFTAQVPDAFQFNASYTLELQATFPLTGTDGSTYYEVGTTYLPLNLTVPAGDQ